MDLTTRDAGFLTFLADHYAASAEQLRANVSPENADTTVVRRRLRKLHAAGLVGIARAEVLTPNNAAHGQVYHPTEKGMLALAKLTGQMRRVLTPTKPPYAQHLAHFLALTDLRVLITTAVAAQAVCTLTAYFNQFDTTNPDAADPKDRFTLYTEVGRDPRKVVCVPDAAFSLAAGGRTKAYYVELERGTTPPARAAAKKSPGYAGLATGNLHRSHFPDSSEPFSVLVIAPHAGWRDHLRREFATKSGAELYKFAAQGDVTAESLLFDPIWHPCAGDPQPLLKGARPVVVTGGVPAGAHPGTGDA
jgi:hypothetical protein